MDIANPKKITVKLFERKERNHNHLKCPIKGEKSQKSN
jgi:hypothetical protein